MQVLPDIIVRFNYMNACCFSQHPGLPFSCMGSWQRNPVILLPTANPPVTSPCATTAAPCHRLPVLSTLVFSPAVPLSTLTHNLHSSLCQAIGHISSQQFPSPFFHPCFQTRFLTAGPKYLLHPKSPAPVFLSRLLQATYLCNFHKQRPVPFPLTIWGPGGE